MTKFIFSVPFTADEETRLLIAVVVATSYIPAKNRLIADDPIWGPNRGVEFLWSYPTNEKASIKFGVV